MSWTGGCVYPGSSCLALETVVDVKLVSHFILKVFPIWMISYVVILIRGSQALYPLTDLLGLHGPTSRPQCLCSGWCFISNATLTHSHPSTPHFLHPRPAVRQTSSTMHLSQLLLSLGHLYILLLNFSPTLISLFKYGIALYVLLIISWASLISPVREWQCNEEKSAWTT